MRTLRARAHGFTMIELIVTMTVGGILMALAVPAFNTFIQNQRLTTATNSLVLSLNLARSEALKRDLPTGVTVCASGDGLACNGASWSQGWIVIDTSGGANAGVLQGVPTIGTNDTISEAAGQLQAVFQSNGTVAQAASFTVCDSRGAAFAHSIDLGPTGRVLTSATPGLTVNGAALVCP
jgi:type IV fimbrial biogenesis protein FimT